MSERQWRDAVGVIAVQGARFDVSYARTWADRLALTEPSERALVEGSEVER
jgi:hypothetical protein